MEYLENLWELFVEMSFYIVIGILFTGVLHAFVNKNAILKHAGKDSVGSVVKASVIGVPLPLCSCGVVPMAMFLGQSGASKGAVVSFLTSTPQTGIDSIIATYGLMGPLFAAYRAVTAFISGIFAGIMTNVLCKKEKISFENAQTTCCCSGGEEEVETTSCCSTEPGQTETTCCCSSEAEETEETCCCSTEIKETETTCCCSTEPEQTEATCCCSTTISNENLTFGEKIKSVFTFGFGEFLDEIAKNFVIGLLIAALISTVLPEDFLSGIESQFISMLLMLIIGIPMYVCSTASIPIALSLIMKGISPGAAFVFLFAGPVTNIASLAILRKTLSKKVIGIYLGSVAVCAMVFGYLLDYIIEAINYTGIKNIVESSSCHGTPVYMTVVAIIFGILVLKSLIKGYFYKKIKK